MHLLEAFLEPTSRGEIERGGSRGEGAGGRAKEKENDGDEGEKKDFVSKKSKSSLIFNGMKRIFYSDK